MFEPPLSTVRDRTKMIRGGVHRAAVYAWFIYSVTVVIPVQLVANSYKTQGLDFCHSFLKYGYCKAISTVYILSLCTINIFMHQFLR